MTNPGSRGQVLVLFALFLVVLLGIAALTVDYGYWLGEERQLQNAADEAAQAGVSELLHRPITSAKQGSALDHAMLYVDERLGLGLAAAGQIDCAAAAATAADGFGPEDSCGSYAGSARIWIHTPVTGATSCTGASWGDRAVNVRIEQTSTRFFSRVYGGGDPIVGVCATSAIQGGGLAVAVLKPNQTSPDTYTTQPNNSTLTMKLAGQNSFVRIWNGDVGINSLFSAAGAPPPQSANQPAYVKFMTADGTGVSDNWMYMTINQPSPMTWDVNAKQIRTEGQHRGRDRRPIPSAKTPPHVHPDPRVGRHSLRGDERQPGHANRGREERRPRHGCTGYRHVQGSRQQRVGPGAREVQPGRR